MIAQIDIGKVVEIGKDVGSWSTYTVLGVLCILSVCCVGYMIKKVFSLLIPTIVDVTATLRVFAEEMRRFNDGQKNR